MQHLLEFPLLSRPRRNRKNSIVRDLAQETTLLPRDLVSPLFVKASDNDREPILSMPGIYRLSCDAMIQEAEELCSLGINAIALFPVIDPENKDRLGSYALSENQVIIKAIHQLKREVPDVCIIVDIALDPYTDHGHDGLLGKNGSVQNDETVQVLCKMAVQYAEAGADIVAPSDMMDGRVGAIRRELDANGYCDVSILSYAAKYASSFYGPFRDALNSSLSKGNKKSYQMNPANRREAILESILDEKEGADFIMIKPALPYLDVILKVKESTHLPVGAYHVSGEYAMVMAAAAKGWLDADLVFSESLIAIKRAGADFIFSYAAKRIASLYRYL